VAPDVSSAGLGLVSPPPDGPAQAVVDGVFVAVGEVEEPADFGEGERDETSADGWLGWWFGRVVGWVWVFGWCGPLFLACCAATARKV
jgi:hypothetical protein